MIIEKLAKAYYETHLGTTIILSTRRLDGAATPADSNNRRLKRCYRRAIGTYI